MLDGQRESSGLFVAKGVDGGAREEKKKEK